MTKQQDSDGPELKLVGEFNRIQGYKGDEHHLMARAAIAVVNEAMSRQLVEKDEALREAYREGWYVNAVEPEDEAHADYIRGCEEVDWQASIARKALEGSAPCQ